MNNDDLMDFEPENIETNDDVDIEDDLIPFVSDINNNHFSMLNRYGENLTKKKYITNPAIARDEEINKMILILLSPEKSVVLTGKAGIGKTSIVEGLNYRIQRKDVPNALLNCQIYKINTSSLLGTYNEGGNEEAKLQLLINEIMGKKEITDKSNINHLGISKFPFIVTKVKPSKLRSAIDKAKANPNLLVADYPKDMLDTRTDEELVDSISNKKNEELEYLGALIYGNTDDVNEITGKFGLWKLD